MVPGSGVSMVVGRVIGHLSGASHVACSPRGTDESGGIDGVIWVESDQLDD